MAYRNILIPLDGSELAEKALEHAKRIACSDTHFTLLAVVDEDRLVELAQAGSTVGNTVALNSAYGVPCAEIYSPAEISAREHYLTKVAEHLREAGFQVSTEIRCGKPSIAIVDASCEAVDLIIMASHRRTGFGKFLLGSVAERVLHETSCPVLIV